MKKYILFPLLVIVAFLAAAPATHASTRYRSSYQYQQQYYYSGYNSYDCGCYSTRNVNYGYMPYSVGPYMNSYYSYQQPAYYGNGGYYNTSGYYNGGSFGGALLGGFIGGLIGSGQRGYDSYASYQPTYYNTSSYGPYIDNGGQYYYGY